MINSWHKLYQLATTLFHYKICIIYPWIVNNWVSTKYSCINNNNIYEYVKICMFYYIDVILIVLIYLKLIYDHINNQKYLLSF